QPLVEIVLVWSLFKSLVSGTTRAPDEASAISGVSRKDRVEPLLKLADLLRAPPVWRIKQTRRDIPPGEMLQLHRLAAQCDIDRSPDLADWAETVRLMRPRVPRQINQLVARQETPRPPVNDLLVSGGRRPRPPTCRTIDDIESDDIAATVAAQFKGCRVE